MACAEILPKRPNDSHFPITTSQKILPKRVDELSLSGVGLPGIGISPNRDQHTKPTKCSHCRATCGELGITDVQRRKGGLKAHEYLCQGIGFDGRPLGIPRACLVPGCHDKDKTATAWKMHYHRQHDIRLGDDCDLQHLRERYHLWLLPDFEMNAYWGCFASRKNPLMEEEAQKYFHQATGDPFTFEVEHKWELLNTYRDIFE